MSIADLLPGRWYVCNDPVQILAGPFVDSQALPNWAWSPKCQGSAA